MEDLQTGRPAAQGDRIAHSGLEIFPLMRKCHGAVVSSVHSSPMALAQGPRFPLPFLIPLAAARGKQRAAPAPLDAGGAGDTAHSHARRTVSRDQLGQKLTVAVIPLRTSHPVVRQLL
jgi:hypothetical protein